jgi:hypothetical protein
VRLTTIVCSRAGALRVVLGAAVRRRRRRRRREERRRRRGNAGSLSSALRREGLAATVPAAGEERRGGRALASDGGRRWRRRDEASGWGFCWFLPESSCSGACSNCSKQCSASDALTLLCSRGPPMSRTAHGPRPMAHRRVLTCGTDVSSSCASSFSPSAHFPRRRTAAPRRHLAAARDG